MIQLNRIKYLIYLIKALIKVQLESLIYLIVYIILHTYKLIKEFNKKEETIGEKIINYLENHKKLIVHNILLLCIPPVNPLWAILQLYTIISSLICEDINDSYSNAFSIVLNLILCSILKLW
nr:hypothetical protein BXAP_18 [Babesia sp. Xinjiang]QAX26981.1 hypothetical protein [Babesia sp. Xinjiang]